MNVNGFLKYRRIWLGLALLWIMRFHLGFYPDNPVMDFLTRIGYGGTDVCLFASGLGCYYSLKKDPEPWAFLKRRFWRLYPTYLLFIAVWLIYKILTVNMPLSAVVGNLLGIEFFMDRQMDFNWYVSILFLLYLLAPIFSAMVDRLKWWGQVLAVALLVAASFACWGDNYHILGATRLAGFYVGMLVGRLCHNGSFAKRHKIAAVGTTIFGWCLLIALWQLDFNTLWHYGLFWYPFLLITPGMCVLYSKAALALEKIAVGRGLLRCLDKVGENSFELFLVHYAAIDVMEYMIEPMGLLPKDDRVWILAPVVFVAGCVALRLGAEELKQWMRRICKRVDRKEEAAG